MRGVVPLAQDGVALRRGQNVQAPDRPVGCRKRRLEKTHQPPRHRLDAGAIEQVGGVLQNARYPGRRSVGRALLAKADREVELGGGGGDRLKRGGEPRQVKADRGVVLERQHHLEQRMTGQRAGRVDDLDQPFERQLLMVVGGEIGGPHTGNQVAEARIAAGVGAQHQGVDEEPDQIVERTVGAARDRAPDRDVGAGAQPGEQGRDTGLQHHEQAGPAVAGQTHQSLMEPRPQRQRDTVAAMARRPPAAADRSAARADPEHPRACWSRTPADGPSRCPDRSPRPKPRAATACSRHIAPAAPQAPGRCRGSAPRRRDQDRGPAGPRTSRRR